MAPMCSLGGQRNHPEGGLPGTGEAVTLAQAWSHPHLNPLSPHSCHNKACCLHKGVSL